MSWQILLLISVIATSISAIYQKKTLNVEKTNPVVFSIGFQLSVSLLVGFALIIRGFDFENLFILIPGFIFMMLIYAVGNLLRYGSLKKVDISRYTILFQLNVIVSVVASYIFLKEQLSFFQIVGIMLIFAGALIVLWKKKILKLHKGDWLAISSAIVYGIAFVNDALIVRTFDPLTFVFLAFLGPGLVLAIIFPKKLIQIKSLVSKEVRYGFFMASILSAISAVTLYSAYKIGRNAAQLSSLNQISAVLIVILGILLLKEKDKLYRNIIGIIISTIGVLLLV
ncbi:MAG: DMT family transporter [Candidatus Berkelbacteria bacterium]